MNKEKFDGSLYNLLQVEDRQIIDDYVEKMAIAEINSFMRRLLAFPVQEEVKIEVVEALDEINVFETIKIAKIKSADKISFIKIYEMLDNYLVKTKNKRQVLFLRTLYKYFESCYDKSGFDIKLFDNNQIKKIYFDCADEIEKRVITILPIQLYTYRPNKKRFGIVIENYNQNYKMYNIKIMIDRKDISGSVKSAVYWSSKNAKQHGFNKKVGIIWFKGSSLNDCWQFPDGSIVKNKQKVTINLILANDASSKMFQRFNIKQKLKEIKDKL